MAFNISEPANRDRAATSPSPVTADNSRLHFREQIHRRCDSVSHARGKIANTRAGKPEPAFGFGKLTTAMAPDSGT